MIKKLSGLLIIISGLFWGSMGIFVNTLSSYGFSKLQIAAIRLLVAAICMSIITFFVDRKCFKIKFRHIPLLAATGIIGIGIMGFLYFTTIGLSTLSTAAILLYLSPVAVMLMSAVFLKEKITKLKVVALILAVLGCALVSGLIGSVNISLIALVCGIGSAVTYGSYSIFGTFALKKYKPLTVTTYAFILAAIFFLTISEPYEIIKLYSYSGCTLKLILISIGTGIITAVIPFALYTIGLKYCDASKAAILACSEPVAATIFGMIVYSQFPDLFGFIGILLVLTAIVILNIKTKKKRK